MSTRMDEIRARVSAMREGYDVHIGCGGEVDRDCLCHCCDLVVMPADIADYHIAPVHSRELYARDVEFLLAEIDKLGGVG